jgi:hypothetical protein
LEERLNLVSRRHSDFTRGAKERRLGLKNAESVGHLVLPGSTAARARLHFRYRVRLAAGFPWESCWPKKAGQDQGAGPAGRGRPVLQATANCASARSSRKCR